MACPPPAGRRGLLTQVWQVGKGGPGQPGQGDGVPEHRHRAVGGLPDRGVARGAEGRLESVPWGRTPSRPQASPGNEREERARRAEGRAAPDDADIGGLTALRSPGHFATRPTPNWSPVFTTLPPFQCTSTIFSLCTPRPVSSVRAVRIFLEATSITSPVDG